MSDASSGPTYVVTGAAGFVGRQVCAALRARGARVHVVVRRPAPSLERIGVRVWRGDLWDAAPLAEALRDASFVIHCAADPRFGNGPHYERANVALTGHLIEAARAHAPGLRRFVFVSTIGAVDRAPSDACAAPIDEDTPPAPSSDYGRSKLAAERLVQASGLPFSIVRPAMVVGAEMRPDSHFAVFSKAAVTAGAMARLAWPGSLSVIDVRDLAAGILLAATHPGADGRTFFCAGEPVQLAAFFDACRPAWRVPLGVVAAVARRLPQAVPFSLKGLLLPALTASDARLRALGWTPRHTAAESLAPVVARERARVDVGAAPGGQTVVTGAASGLGRAVAGRLAATRERLLLVDRDAAGLAAVAAAHPNCVTRVADLSTPAGLDELLASPEWNAHPVAELYACAGLGARGRMQEVPVERHREIFAVNVLARITLAHAAIAGMLERHFGRVVIISSSSAFQPLPYMATYASSNAALLSLGEAWGAEVAGDGVHVMTVCPGGMKTSFQRSAGVKEIEGESLMAPEDVADAILAGLGQGRTTLVVSTRSRAMALLARVLPRRVSVALWHRLMEKLR